MALTAIKPNNQLLDMETVNPFWTWSPTFKHITKLLFESKYPLLALEHDVCGDRCDRCSRSSRACSPPTRSCGCASRARRRVGGLIFLAYLVPPSILFIPLATVIYNYGLFDSPLALILVYPTILIPFSTWLLMGYFKTIPYELEECALIDGASALADPDQDRAAARDAGPDLGLHLLLHAVLERVHLRADLPAIGRTTRPCRSRS